MPIPTVPEDRNLPKGPNFLAIVIGFAVAILVLLLATWMFLGHKRKLIPMDTKGATPSQSRLYTTPPRPAILT